MIKILINEEEVVSNSNLQIKEEMLSTSSTILKNCYPKSWELDKDYTSRYYYPKDYSKCEIYDIERPTNRKNLINIEEGYEKGYIDEDGTLFPSDYAATFNFKIPVEGGVRYCISANQQIQQINMNAYNENDELVVVTSAYDRQSYSRVIPASGTSYITVSIIVDDITPVEITDELINSLEIMVEKDTRNRTEPYEPYVPEEIETLIFCGFTKNTGNVSLNPRHFHGVDLQILDFKDLLSTGETLNYVIANKTITEAINQVVNSISDYGFVVGNIQLLNPNEMIGAYSTLNKTAYDVFQYFANITQSRWNTRVIDENTVAIDFIDPTLMPVGTEIETNQQFYEDNEIVDISFSYSTNDYRNKQIMTSDEVYGNIQQTQTLIADGYTKSFTIENKVGEIESITLNGTSVSFITKNEEKLGYSGDFIYQPGETTITSSNTIAVGGVIIITYLPIVKGREIILNTTESNRIQSQINRNGVISRYENRNDSTTSSELQKIGQSYIKYKGQAEITLKVKATKNLWEVGEVVSYNAPLEDLNTNYMVKSKQIDMYLNANKIIYTYELTSNFNYENAVNYFDNQRAKKQGNIGEGEVITRNIDLINEALIIFYDTEIDEIQVSNPTSLDFALDGVLI